MYMNIMMAFRQLMARSFAVLFFTLSLILMGIAAKALLDGLSGVVSLTDGYLRTINMAVVALAMFELGLVVIKEYATNTDHDVITVLRRTVPRFVALVCIALVLEGLLMVIKYSQLDLAGNLPYPVAIIFSAAFLLFALGAFLRLSEKPRQALAAAPAESTYPATQPTHPVMATPAGLAQNQHGAVATGDPTV